MTSDKLDLEFLLEVYLWLYFRMLITRHSVRQLQILFYAPFMQEGSILKSGLNFLKYPAFKALKTFLNVS